LSPIQQVVLASNNQGKLREMGQILAPLGIELLAQSHFNVPVVDESGLTYVENAILKARMAARVSGLPAIADDSGIEVDVLGGAPGIYSARYAGANATDQENLDLLVNNVVATGAAQPTARYQCIIVYMRDAGDATPIIAAGTWDGHIVFESRGTNGFGYDPNFFVPTHGCTSAELPPEVKNLISHRGQALQNLVQALKNMKHIAAG
jgi:XTP/dITP diphosphohydrolase